MPASPRKGIGRGAQLCYSRAFPLSTPSPARAQLGEKVIHRHPHEKLRLETKDWGQVQTHWAMRVGSKVTSQQAVGTPLQPWHHYRPHRAKHRLLHREGWSEKGVCVCGGVTATSFTWGYTIAEPFLFVCWLSVREGVASWDSGLISRHWLALPLCTMHSAVIGCHCLIGEYCQSC